MAKELLKLFSPESFQGSGSYFADGPYRIESARFVIWDFNGKGKDTACLCCKLQPLDKAGKDAGEEVVQYWSVGEDFALENKGKSLSATGDRSNIWPLCDYAVFIEHGGKNSVIDRDALEEENDISVLDGTTAEFGKVPSPRTRTVEKINPKTNKPYPPDQVIVMTAPFGKASGGGKSEKTADKDSKAKGGSKAAAKDDNKHEEMLQNYLIEAVLVKKNEADGIDKLKVKMGIGRHVQAAGGDADDVKAVTGLYNDAKVLGPILEAAGWKIDGSSIVKE